MIGVNEFAGYLTKYIWSMRLFFGIVGAGICLSTVLLTQFEATADRRFDVEGPRFGHQKEAGESSFVTSRSLNQSHSSRDSMPTGGRTGGMFISDLAQVRNDIAEISTLLKTQERNNSDSLATISQRVTDLEHRVQSISARIEMTDNQPEIKAWSDFGYAFYYTCQAMLTLGNFGPRSTQGKVLVIFDGLWGVLTFSLLTAIFLAAVRSAIK